MQIETIFQRLPEAVNSRPELVRMGRFCNAEFLVEVGELTFRITVEAGQVTSVHRGVLMMRAWCFAIRAGEDAWREFWSPAPRPGFNDIFAMTSRGHAKIEGDMGPLLQNLRYVKELLQLPATMRGQTT